MSWVLSPISASATTRSELQKTPTRSARQAVGAPSAAPTAKGPEPVGKQDHNGDDHGAERQHVQIAELE